MKILKYRLFEDGPEVAMTWSETNEAIAGREACNGEYTIEEDGQPELPRATQEARIAQLEEALDLLLSGVSE